MSEKQLMPDMLKAALWYRNKGFSVIPAKKNKRPYVKWQDFQKSPPTEVQIREWWQEWPNANIAIITGMNSNLTVLDADSEDGKKAIEEFIPDTLSIPVVKTPKGWHYYFKYSDGIRNEVRFLTDCDIRSEGGYVIAPPSKNGASTRYIWLDNCSIDKNDPPEIPSFLLDLISNSNENYSNNIASTRTNSLLYTSQIVDDKSEQVTTNDDKIPQGSRDSTLFTLANYLVRGGLQVNKIRFFLRFFASHCTPPFPENEIENKIKSALDRSKRRDVNVSEIVREYVLSSRGVFLSSECSQVSSLSSREEKKAMSKVLSRMVDEGIIERVGKRNGQFRLIDRTLNKIDIYNVSSEYLDIKYPLSIHELFKTMPKNIIVVAGTPNVGKTSFMLNFASLNMNKGMAIRYFTSEMGEMELANRCKMFEPEIPFSFWKDVDFCDHSSDFADKIDPDGLNIIDYLEMSSEFWLVGEKLGAIYEKLNKGIAVVALQKKFGQRYGRGAEFSLEKPRLYLSLDSNPPEGNIATIEKCKNHAREDVNPNHMECVFNVIQGVKIRMACNWAHPKLKEV